MEFNLREEDVCKLVLGYLKQKGSYEALCAFALETNLANGTLSDELLFLQRLVLQGRWDDVSNYLEPFKEQFPHLSIKLDFCVKKQKFLEMLSWQGGGGQRFAFPPWKPSISTGDKSGSEEDEIFGNTDLETMLAFLNTIKGLCSIPEFNSLCMFLTLEKLDDHPEYGTWTVSEGRYSCFTQLRNLLWEIAPGKNLPEPTVPPTGPTSPQSLSQNGLMRMLAMGLSYQHAVSTRKSFVARNEPQPAQLHAETGLIVPNGELPSKLEDLDSSPRLVMTRPVVIRTCFEMLPPAGMQQRTSASPLAAPKEPSPDRRRSTSNGRGGRAARDDAGPGTPGTPGTRDSSAEMKNGSRHPNAAAGIDARTSSSRSLSRTPSRTPSPPKRSVSLAASAAGENRTASPPPGAAVSRATYKECRMNSGKFASTSTSTGAGAGGSLSRSKSPPLSRTAASPPDRSALRSSRTGSPLKPRAQSPTQSQLPSQQPQQEQEQEQQLPQPPRDASPPQRRPVSAESQLFPVAPAEVASAATERSVSAPTGAKRHSDSQHKQSPLQQQHQDQEEEQEKEEQNDESRNPPQGPGAVSWVVGDEEGAAATAALKPMPAALRRKMEEDKLRLEEQQRLDEAAAAAEAAANAGGGSGGKGPPRRKGKVPTGKGVTIEVLEPAGGRPSGGKAGGNANPGYQPPASPSTTLTSLSPSPGKSKSFRGFASGGSPAGGISRTSSVNSIGSLGSSSKKLRRSTSGDRISQLAKPQVRSDGTSSPVVDYKPVQILRRRSYVNGSPDNNNSSRAGGDSTPGSSAPNSPRPPSRSKSFIDTSSEFFTKHAGEGKETAFPCAKIDRTLSAEINGMMGGGAAGSDSPRNTQDGDSLRPPLGTPQGSVDRGGPVVEYERHELYTDTCPLRTVASLDVGFNRKVSLAIGSNAKSVYSISYTRDLMQQPGVGFGGGIEDGRGGILLERGGDDNSSMLSAFTSQPPVVRTERELNNIHKGSVYTMDYHPTLRLLVTGSNDKTLRLSRPSSGEVSEALKGHTGTIRVARFLLADNAAGSDGETAYLASAGAGDCLTRLWDVRQGECVRTFSGEETLGAVHGLEWMDKNLLITGCDQGGILGHDLRTSKPAWSFNLNEKVTKSGLADKQFIRRGICCLSMLNGFSSSTLQQSNTVRPVVAGCNEGFVTIFNPLNGQIFSHSRQHKDDVRSLSVLSVKQTRRQITEGQQKYRILTGSYDGTAALWTVVAQDGIKYEYQNNARVLKGHTDKVLSAIMLSPAAGEHATFPDIVTTGADGKAILHAAFKPPM